MYDLIDTHSHLSQIEDIDASLAAARDVGIIAIIAVGSDLPSNKKVIALAEAHKGFVYAALGMHPWRLKDIDVAENLAYIEANIDRASAIGEVGLDYDKRVISRAEREPQFNALRQVLHVAQAHGKPALVHSRYAWRDCLALIEEAQLSRVVFHWFAGPPRVLQDILGRGFYISATPAAGYHEEHRRAVETVPLERLFLETDSPVKYMPGTPDEYESRPVHLLRGLEIVSRLRGVDEARLAAITTENARRFFGL